MTLCPTFHDEDGLFALVALGAAICAAISGLALRRLGSAGEPVFRTAFYFGCGSLVTAALLWLDARRNVGDNPGASRRGPLHRRLATRANAGLEPRTAATLREPSVFGDSFQYAFRALSFQGRDRPGGLSRDGAHRPFGSDGGVRADEKRPKAGLRGLSQKQLGPNLLTGSGRIGLQILRGRRRLTAAPPNRGRAISGRRNRRNRRSIPEHRLPSSWRG